MVDKSNEVGNEKRRTEVGTDKMDGNDVYPALNHDTEVYPLLFMGNLYGRVRSPDDKASNSGHQTYKSID